MTCFCCFHDQSRPRRDLEEGQTFPVSSTPQGQSDLNRAPDAPVVLASWNLKPQLQQPAALTINYDYDPLNRLTEANYSNSDYYHYMYDAVGNRKKQTTSIGGLVSITNYNYFHANRLTDVDDVSYVYDNNGNLKDDGVNEYQYDSANRLISFSGQGVNATYSYNGLGDRLQQVINGAPTTYTLDLNTSLPEVLSDGESTYLYDLDNIAQTGT